VRTKNDKYAKDRRKNIVGPSDPYVLALSGGDLDLADLDSGPRPAFIKAVLSPDKTLRTADGRAVHTDAFLQKDYDGISGILFSPWSITNAPDCLGNDLMFLHNPLALNPLPVGTFRFGREFWMDQSTGELREHDWCPKAL
jgi:hypothetical protein